MEQIETSVVMMLLGYLAIVFQFGPLLIMLAILWYVRRIALALESPPLDSVGRSESVGRVAATRSYGDST